MTTAIELAYIAAALLFVAGLKLQSWQTTARRGNGLSALGMWLAFGASLLHPSVTNRWGIAAGLAAGTILGLLAAYRVAMTRMPEMVALLNGFGGLGSLLVGCEDYYAHGTSGSFSTLALVLSVAVGGLTFSGSMVAWAKLGERWPRWGAPIAVQRAVVLAACLALLVTSAGLLVAPASGRLWMGTLIVLSFGFGVLAVSPIGGADMPVVISLLNSYSGVAAAATGFVLDNTVLVVAGSLVGASGLILTRIMCRAMNRSLANVLLGGFGTETASGQPGAGAGAARVRTIGIDEAAVLLEAARSVVIVPGYGLAVAQAHHAARELTDALAQRGAEVRYAIHPVAGRMPGHMNVLLAEANVPYDQLFEMAHINPLLPATDVCLVIGANDVVNPAAREQPGSPIYGMPIIDADGARSVIVLKRSMAHGFAAIANPLFTKPNVRMLFGDARATLQALGQALKEY
jgi:NAD(P) transhydrogenase subunit beta